MTQDPKKGTSLVPSPREPRLQLIIPLSNTILKPAKVDHTQRVTYWQLFICYYTLLQVCQHKAI